MKTKENNQIKIFEGEGWRDYELLDTGEGEKLERFGEYRFVRPYEDAVWNKTSTKKEWEDADGKFWSSKTGAKSGWTYKKEIAKSWVMDCEGIKFTAAPTPFRHLSFFPEQKAHWEFIESTIKDSGRKIKFLNLFGYTGVASLFALRAGAEVTHVDASKQSLALAKENQDLNSHLGLEDMPMRIIPDDVLKFLEREIKRGNKYDAIIMDPPKFGRGPKGETWKIEEQLPALLDKVARVLSSKPLFVILTSYSTDSSSLALGYALKEALKDFKGTIEQGELCIKETSNGRSISLAHTAVWQAE